MKEHGIEILEQREKTLTEEEAREFYDHVKDQVGLWNHFHFSSVPWCWEICGEPSTDYSAWQLQSYSHRAVPIGRGYGWWLMSKHCTIFPCCSTHQCWWLLYNDDRWEDWESFRAVHDLSVAPAYHLISASYPGLRGLLNNYLSSCL